MCEALIIVQIFPATIPDRECNGKGADASAGEELIAYVNFIIDGGR